MLPTVFLLALVKVQLSAAYSATFQTVLTNWVSFWFLVLLIEKGHPKISLSVNC